MKTTALSFLWGLTLIAVAAGQRLDGRIFTARDGRTMEAEIVSYRGADLRIKRADLGKEMTLPLAALSDEDQRAVRAFLSEHPELRQTVQPNDIRVEFSRAKFERETTARDVYADQDVESWGYTVAVANLTNASIEDLRVEYVVFALEDPDEVSKARKSSREVVLRRTTGREVIPSIAAGRRETLRTKPVVTRRTRYDESVRIITAEGKRLKSWRDYALHGVWLRVYDGDVLVQEASSPESLTTSEQWAER